MRIALFGATGPTGKFVIEEALRQGHSLSVYTREAMRATSATSKSSRTSPSTMDSIA